ncbi:MAG: class I SAM-dependent methyltransferase [Tepidisphaeraceae bacterium]
MDEDRTTKLTARYDQEALAYRDLWAPILRVAGRGLLKELPGMPVQRILDVGAGVGSLLPDLRAMFPGASVLGVDRSRGMLALAPTELARAVMDATRLAMSSGSVDLVLLVFVLFHLENAADGLREARRVLRRSGLVGVLTWARQLESRAMQIWDHCLDAHGADAADPAALARHDSFDAPEKLELLLRHAGFTDVRAWADELVACIGLEHLLLLKTSMGSSRPRFQSLDPRGREACVADARRRMEVLHPDDFVARGRVVYAVAGV